MFISQGFFQPYSLSFGFSFSGLSLLVIEFPKVIYDLLIFFCKKLSFKEISNIWSFIFFSSFLISFKNFPRNFIANILHLGFAFLAGSDVEILSIFYWK